jgi:hypothetical protein
MVKRKKVTGIRREAPAKEHFKRLKGEILNEFHVISEGLIDQIKHLAEGHSGIIDWPLKIVICKTASKTTH